MASQFSHVWNASNSERARTALCSVKKLILDEHASCQLFPSLLRACVYYDLEAGS